VVGWGAATEVGVGEMQKRKNRGVQWRVAETQKKKRGVQWRR